MRTSANQSVKPTTTQINSNNNLEIGGCDVVELAQKYGTPLYVIDEKSLRTVCRDYKSSFEQYPHINMMYASKALCTSAIAKIVSSECFGFDVVSTGEIYTIQNAGCDMSKVLFNGNNKTPEELEFAINSNVGRFSVDNFQELFNLNEIAKQKGKVADILLRITPGIECHTHEYIQTGHLDSKFGFDMTQIDEALELITSNYPNLKLHGLHAHIGSQIFETQVYIDEIEILVKELARIDEKYGLKLDEVNIGGGLGVKYTEKDEPPSIYEISKLIVETLDNASKKHNVALPTLFIEPGRSVISTSGVTLYTIGSQKQVPNATKYVSVDGGMADNPRPSMYQAEYFAEIANKADEENSQKVTIAGRYCESGDILIKDIELPIVDEGDILCVYNTGAYNYSMASNYNRTQKPAMVLVNSGLSDIIIKRETLEDIVQHDVIPDRLK